MILFYNQKGQFVSFMGMLVTSAERYEVPLCFFLLFIL